MPIIATRPVYYVKDMFDMSVRSFSSGGPPYFDLKRSKWVQEVIGDPKRTTDGQVITASTLFVPDVDFKSLLSDVIYTLDEHGNLIQYLAQEETLSRGTLVKITSKFDGRIRIRHVHKHVPGSKMVVYRLGISPEVYDATENEKGKNKESLSFSEYDASTYKWEAV